MDQTKKLEEDYPLILLFSPRQQVRSIIAAGLLHGNYRIIEADSSYIAGVKASQYVPSLVIVDIARDNIRDFLFLSRLERSVRTRDVSILLSVTTDVRKALDDLRSEIGPPTDDSTRTHMIEYPFHFSQLLQKIDEILGHRKGGGDTWMSHVPPQNEAIALRIFNHLVPAETKLSDVEKTVSRQWAFPFTVARAMDIAETDGSCCNQLSRCIETDVAATSALLGIANRITFAKRTGRISNVSEAVVRLGFVETRNILSSLALIDISSGIHRKYGFSRTDFWIHSLSVAIIAEKICAGCRFPNPGLAFIAGLVHDVGKVPLDNNFTSVFPYLLEETTNRIAPFSEVEQELMGFTHADLGAHFAKIWNFPQHIVSAIANHHSVERILASTVPLDRMLQEAVFAANVFAKAMGMGHSCDEVVEEIPPEMLKALGLPKGPDREFISDVLDRFKKYYEYLKLSPRDVFFLEPNTIERDFEIIVVYGAKTEFHPLVLALQNAGHHITIGKNLPAELPKAVKIAVFIPDRGSPLDVTIDASGEDQAAKSTCLRLFLLDGLGQRDRRRDRDLSESSIVLLDRRQLDVRLAMHVIEDYNYASAIG